MCIFAGMFGCKHDPAKFILGHWIFSPLAKVSFCVYLTHFIVIMNGTFSARMELFWQETTSLYIVITDIFWSVVCATFLSALVESPILGMEKVLMGGGKDRK
jgi:peptidoglycan/LPS O-acetylase OafA/YrhL